MAKLGRLARTVRGLHPLQVVARPPHWLLRRAVRDIPSVAAPRLRESWPPAPPELRALVEEDARRAAARLPALPASSLLRAYEESYGFDALCGRRRWEGPISVHPYPASVRARQLALATRLGARGLEAEMARACRAIALQPELHLLANHLLENALGLVCGAAAAEGPEAQAWWELGARLLAWQLDEQFLADGGHFERSATYHLWLTAGLLEAIELAEASGRVTPPQWRAVAGRALDWIAAIRAPDGAYPLFNDAMLDGSVRADAVLALGRALGFSIELRTTPTPGPWARHLETTGWLLMGAPGGVFLALDAGPDGADCQPGHVHADALAFELWIGGQRTCVDYGVSSYGADFERQRCRSTSVHNTLELPGIDSSEVWAGFRTGRRSTGKLLHRTGRSDAIEATATHDGYAWLPGGPRPMRTLRLEANRLAVSDSLEGGPREFASRLRLDEEAAARVNVRCVSAPFTRSLSVWYPTFATARPAVVFEARAKPGTRCEWLIEW